MDEFIRLAEAAAARVAAEDMPLAGTLAGTAPTPVSNVGGGGGSGAPTATTTPSSTSVGRTLAREEWLRKREIHLAEARRAQQAQAEAEVASYFSPEINKVSPPPMQPL